MNEKKDGYVYIMINASLQKNMLKIGMTKRTPEIRAIELSEETGLPSEFIVAYEQKVSDCELVEYLIHQRLIGHRVTNFRFDRSREFFKFPLKKAIEIVRKIANEYSLNIQETENIDLKSLQKNSKNRLLKIAQAILDGNLKQDTSDLYDPDNPFYFILQDNSDKIIEIILELISKRLPDRYGFSAKEDIRVLTFVAEGKLGTLNLNRIIMQKLNDNAPIYAIEPDKLKDMPAVIIPVHFENMSTEKETDKGYKANRKNVCEAILKATDLVLLVGSGEPLNLR